MVKIYTGFGDKGKTRLFGSKVVNKNNLRVECYGTFDELNSVLGLAVSFCDHPQISNPLKIVQGDIFRLSTELATPAAQIEKIKEISLTATDIQNLEVQIDRVQEELEPLQNFIIPGGGRLASYLHLARTVCRRGERRIISLIKKEKINPLILIYCNRLSDYLFVLSRLANQLDKIPDVIWKSGK